MKHEQDGRRSANRPGGKRKRAPVFAEETPQAELARLREELRVTKAKAALYEEVVSLASEQYGIELLKNFGPKQ